MIRKKNEPVKPLQEIEISVTEILITGDGTLKPYIQTFHYEPENIAMASLGSVLGVFEIEDQSEDSAYIVNFLASVAKKEYFSHPKRPAIESLEATLHKINLALSELIKQDNTAWLGKLNAILCVFEKNNVHFSVSGKAKTLLIRNGVLSDISDGLAEDSSMHPMKTFTEVSSGRLKTDDKIILTTPGLFEVFSPEELQKSATRFSQEKFSQLLKTALVNQLSFGSTLIVDIIPAIFKEPTLRPAKPTEDTATIPNVFSQSAFSDKKTAIQNNPSVQESPDTIQNEIIDQDANYTDSKTGHIYVQGDVPLVQPNEKWIHTQWLIEEYIDAFTTSAKKISARTLRNMRTFLASKTNRTTPLPDTDIKEEQSLQYEETTLDENDSTDATPSTESTPATSGELAQKAKAFLSFFAHIRPRFSIIKIEFAKLNSQQKKYAIGALISIFVIPFIFIQWQGSTKSTAVPVEEKPVFIAPQPLLADKNIHFIASTQSIFTNNTIVTTLLLKDVMLAVTKNAIVNISTPERTQNYALPEAFGDTILQATVMNDLNTIFLLTNTGKVISFSPSNRAFADNKITLPDTANVTDIATYLTYLYALDSKTDTIYRYPRADGGFGEGAVWLKETIDMQNTDTMAINEDLYLGQNTQILAFNKGKRDPLAFENSATPIVFSQLFTQTNVQYVYALDTVNGRLIQFEKSGALVNQYAHDKMKNATSITVDEATKKAYFTTSSEVFSIDIN